MLIPMRLITAVPIMTCFLATACATASRPVSTPTTSAVQEKPAVALNARHALANYAVGNLQYLLAVKTTAEIPGTTAITSETSATVLMEADAGDTATIFHIRVDSIVSKSDGDRTASPRVVRLEVVAGPALLEWSVPTAAGSATTCVSARLFLDLMPALFNVASGFPNALQWSDSANVVTCGEGVAIVSRSRRRFEYRPGNNPGVFEVQLDENAGTEGAGAVGQHNVFIAGEGRGTGLLAFDGKGFAKSHMERSSLISVTASGRTTKVLQKTSVDFVRRD